MKLKKRDECEGCNFSCPWIYSRFTDNSVIQCPTWIDMQNERQILKMVKLSGKKLDRCPSFYDLEFEGTEKEFKAGIEEIKRIHTDINHLFFIFSNPGTGKTHALLAYTMHLLTIGIDVYYITSARLRNVWLDYMNRFEMEGWGHEEIISIQDCDILIIDDFGREGYSLTGHFQKNLEGILTSTGRKTILASNLSIEDEKFPYKNEEWIMDRLNDAVKISWYGESFRKPTKEGREVKK